MWATLRNECSRQEKGKAGRRRYPSRGEETVDRKGRKEDKRTESWGSSEQQQVEAENSS